MVWLFSIKLREKHSGIRSSEIFPCTILSDAYCNLHPEIYGLPPTEKDWYVSTLIEERRVPILRMTVLLPIPLIACRKITMAVSGSVRKKNSIAWTYQTIFLTAQAIFWISRGYYNHNSAFKLDDGCLAFGTAEGVITFSPSLNFGQHGPIELILTDFKLLYESVKAGMKGSLLKTNINDTQKIGLNYNQNSFSISFSAINFTAPHRIRYEYMLEGHNEEWEHSNSVRSVNYMDLSSGTYTFRLRAFDKYTGQQIGERSLKVVISSPYWVSWWALLFYFILLSVFVYIFVQYRRHKANEDRVKEKIRSFISIAHDIRTPISLIKAPLSELEAQRELPEESKKTVAVAVKNAEKLLSMVTQLLDFTENGLPWPNV